jgi:hypothetical protein
MEGGEGSWIGHIKGSQNSSQGGILSRFYAKYNIKPGTKFRVKIVP